MSTPILGCLATCATALGLCLAPCPSPSDAHTLSVKRAKQAARVQHARCKRLTRHRVRCTTRTHVISITLRGRRIVIRKRLVKTATATAIRPSPQATVPVDLPAESLPAPPCFVKPPAAQLSYAESVEWLRLVADRMVKDARRIAHDGTPIYLPDAGGTYNGVWTRDFAYMASAVPGSELRAGFEYLISRQRADGAVPDHVWADGTPVFNVAGARPPTDNPQFMVELVHQHYLKVGTPTIFTTHSQRLEAALASVPRDSSGLVYIDPEHAHSSYGFTDWVIKTGRELFSSLLFVKAARELSELYTVAGNSAASVSWRDEAERVKAALHPLWDPQVGLFWAASQDGRSHDVWGSAFAVAEGVATPQQALQISDFLRAHRDGIMRHGQVRHLPAGQHWERVVSPLAPGTYQNGGYWSTASGWVMKAVPSLAEDMMRAIVADFRANGVNEWMNDREICGMGVPRYVASAIMPLLP